MVLCSSMCTVTFRYYFDKFPCFTSNVTATYWGTATGGTPY